MAVMTLFAELPVTTVIMLRSIADIAKSEGQDYNQFETRLTCLESFALGGEEADKGKSSYYVSRKMLSKPLEESGKYIAKKGVAGMGAPFVAQLFAKIAAKNQTFLSAKVAAEAVPLAGAVIGAAVNIVFIDYFQEKARGHFIVRRLEKEYGTEEVKQVFEIEAAKEKSVKEVLKKDADRILRQHAWASMGVGLIPVPLADLAGMTIVQLNMLRKLAKAYNVPFSKGIVKNILYSLRGGALSVAVSGPLSASMMKIVPVAGQGRRCNNAGCSQRFNLCSR
ncbi:MAG: EcsC family protein [Desulfobacteraceae bacterium]|nr:EcsC family protein [Desulfobacteraceae bacterium]